MKLSVARRTPSLENLEHRRLLAADTGPAVIEYDPQTGVVETLPVGERINAADADLLDAHLASQGIAGGLDSLLASLGSPTEFLASIDRVLGNESNAGFDAKGDGISDSLDLSGDWSADLGTESVVGSDDRTRVVDATDFPSSAVGRLALGCSGAMIGPYHFLTAGHCVTSGGGFRSPSQLRVTLGQNGSDDAPFGVAEAEFVRVYDSWQNGSAWEDDWAVITLDRSLGNYTGYFGYRVYEGTNALAGKQVSILQYPGDKPNGTQWVASGPIAYSDEGKVFYTGTLDTAGGSSGSGVWEMIDGDTVPQVLGVHGYGTGTGIYNSAARITQQKSDDIGLWKAADDVARPPTEKAEFVVDDQASVLSVLPVGGRFAFDAAVRNVGTLPADGMKATVLLTGPTLAEDIELGEVTFGTMTPFADAATAEVVTRLPAELGEGTYEVQLVLDVDNQFDEYNETDNVVSAGPLTIGTTAAAGLPQQEPNDTFSTATNLGFVGTIEADELAITTGDVDYFRFTAAAAGTVTVDLLFPHFLGDIDAKLYDGDGGFRDASTSATNNERLDASVAAGDELVLEVYGWSGATNSYDLRITGPAGGSVAAPELSSAAFFKDVAQQIDLDFDGIIDTSAVAAGDLVLSNLSTGATFDASGLDFAAGPRGMTWAVPAGGTLLSNGLWQATLPGSSIVSAGGVAAQAPVSFQFGVLNGDADGSGTVNLADFGVLRSNFGRTGFLSAGEGDFNFDGRVDLADFGLLRGSFGQTVATPGSLFADESL
jgi:glutamyl endopeptidase